MKSSEEVREAALMIELRCRAELMNAERLLDAEYHAKIAEAKAEYAKKLAAEVTAVLFENSNQDTKGEA